jgi:hypothetical protein
MTRRDGGLLKSAAAPAIAALFAGCAILGCSNEVIYEEGGDFVGDWMLHSRSSTLNGVSENATEYYLDQDQKQIISFKPSGKMLGREYRRAGNFWVEIPFWSAEEAEWLVNDRKIYIREPDYENDDGEHVAGSELALPYTVTNGKLVFTECRNYYYGEDLYTRCEKETFSKVNLDALKKSFGTIYRYNPKLRGDWVLKDSVHNPDSVYSVYNADSIYLGTALFSGGNRYFDDYDDDMIAEGGWYTTGDTLYLVIDERCYMDWYDTIGFEGGYIERCVPEQTAVLPYSVSGSGGKRTLTIKNDVWKIK